MSCMYIHTSTLSDTCTRVKFNEIFLFFLYSILKTQFLVFVVVVFVVIIISLSYPRNALNSDDFSERDTKERAKGIVEISDRFKYAGTPLFSCAQSVQRRSQIVQESVKRIVLCSFIGSCEGFLEPNPNNLTKRNFIRF